MQPRIENPALTVPGAMPALQRLGTAVRKGGLPETTLYLIELRASQINGCAVCADMVEKGEATYYRTGGSGISRYRTGQFKVGDIRVLWTERGH